MHACVDQSTNLADHQRANCDCWPLTDYHQSMLTVQFDQRRIVDRSSYYSICLDQPGRSVLTVNSVRFIRFQEISVFQTQEPIGWTENQKPISSVSVFNSVFRFLTEQTDGRNQKFNVHNNTRHTSKSMAGNLTRAACAAIPIQSPSPRRSLPSSRCPCPRPRPQPWSRHHPAALVGHPATGICGRGHAAGPLQLGEWRC